MEFGSWSSGLTLVALESRASLAVHVSTRATIWMDFNFNSWFFHHFRGWNSNMYFSQKSFWWNPSDLPYQQVKIPLADAPSSEGWIFIATQLCCEDFVENQLYTAMKEAFASLASSEADVLMLKGGMFGGYPPFTERVHIPSCKRHLWGEAMIFLL